MNQIQDSGVKVRVYNIAHQNYDGEQDLGNCLLAQLVPDAAERIVAVKVDDDLLRATQDPEYNKRVYFSQLDYLNLGNCSEVLLASGGTVYLSEPEVAAQIRERFFATQPDHCVRYGSLLVSSCKEGIVSLDRPLVVRIVDFEHENDLERKVAKSLRTGDCHGKISPRLATMLGGASDTPFQFRLANADYNSPLPAFIAKGTVAVDIQRTDNRGYDLVLDRSSIKGWAKNTGGMKVSQRDRQWRLTPKDNLTPQQAQDWGYLPTILQNQGFPYQIDPKDNSYILNNPPKEVLDSLAHIYDWGLDRIACGTYQLPGLVIGNNSNAQIQEYKNSWQLMQWYSSTAIENDIVPPTLAEAEYLKTIQNDYRLLSQYIVANHDKKQQLKSIDEAELEVEQQEDKDEFGLIAVLRNDTRGELAYHPKVVSFCQDQLRKKWLELATKGANTLLSAMAQPGDISKGTVVAPHLEQGTEVIVTRYPIINKDNIRRYLVDNEQAPELMATKGCVFIHPQDAMEYHQCDFDGDQLVCTPTDLLPTIAAETRIAKPQFDEAGNDLNRDFSPVVKKDKQPYTQASLKHMALAVRLNSIGKIANAVGRVNCARPNPEADLKDRQYFLKMKQGLLEALFDSLQIEADSPKSATRYTDYYPELDKQLFEPFNAPAIARHHDSIDIQQAKSQLYEGDRALYDKLFTFSTGINKYNPVRITAPRHMDWVLGQKTPKASLVFSVLPERITKALGREISKVEVLGKDQNAYATQDFSSPYYQGRELNFTVLPYNDPNSDRHGDPIVYMQSPGDDNYYSLGMFARESSKLPISATFTGQVMMNGRTIDLFIKPGSILVPEVAMPPSPKKQKSKSWRQEIQSNQRDNARRLAVIKSRRLSLSKTRSRSQPTKSQLENQFER